MSDSPSCDDDLLNRLNALKKSSISFNASKPKAGFQSLQQPTPETELSTRLRSLRNASASPSLLPAPKSSSIIDPFAFPSVPSSLANDPDPLRNPIDIDDKTLDELLADLGPEDQWTLDPDDPDDIQKLLNEAQSALPRIEVKPSSSAEEQPKKLSHEEGSSRPDKNHLTRDIDISVFSLDNDEDHGGDRAMNSELDDESREAEDIVARMLDEVNFEREHEPKQEAQKEETDGEEKRTFSLPSAPSYLPSPPPTSTAPSKKSLDFESDIAARMAALSGLGSTNSLGLPSAPSFKPSDKPIKDVMKKQHTDEEIDSWCAICLDVATVKCLGCEGDLYCAACWKEGHMGPDVGWEEKRHKWCKYKKPN